jgi:hypothetical protein
LLRPTEDGAVEATVTSPSGSTARVPPEAILIRSTGPDGGPDPLRIVRGRSEWRYLECVGTRYDQAHFDADAFSGGPCTEIGVFDASSWGTVPDAPIKAVFGDAAALPEDSV